MTECSVACIVPDAVSQSLTVRLACGSSTSVSGGFSSPGSWICVSDASDGCGKIVGGIILFQHLRRQIGLIVNYVSISIHVKIKLY